MMNKNIIGRLREHLDKVEETYDNSWFVICLQGSQNYGIADEESDIDSKCLVIPTAEELVFNKKPISHTLVMENDEHCDVKDIREYFKIVRKSNINFVEIFFTDWYIVNPRYSDLWKELRDNAEIIARINPYRACAAMRGMAYEKYHALEHEYPSRMHMIEKFGYDPKQLSHLMRIEYFFNKFLWRSSYRDCIRLNGSAQEKIYEVKRNGWDEFKEHCSYQDKAAKVLANIDKMYENAKRIWEDKDKPLASEILNKILWETIRRSLLEELI